MSDSFYIDEDCVIGFWVGELGWFLQRYQGLLRYYKQNIYPDHKFILFCNRNLHVFVNDFIYATSELPKWFTDLNLDTDCYEAVLPNSPPGSLLPPTIYSPLIENLRQHYNVEKAVELFPPRGVNFWVDTQLQVFCQYKTDKEVFDRPLVVVFPRTRTRAAIRNVPQFVWYELVENLRKSCAVVLAGVPSGACLADYEADGVINMIKYNEEDKTERLIKYLNSAQCSISSQSGGTHISLLSGCPSYIIGHERERHTVAENRLGTPAYFREVPDYRAIDAFTIIKDVDEFLVKLKESGFIKPPKSEEELIKDDTEKLLNIITQQRA